MRARATPRTNPFFIDGSSMGAVQAGGGSRARGRGAEFSYASAGTAVMPGKARNLSIGLPLVHAAIKGTAGAAAEDGGYRRADRGLELRAERGLAFGKRVALQSLTHAS